MPTEALIGLFTLGGVVIGGMLTAFFELWKRALECQAAARVIRMETVENRVRLGLVLKGDSPWERHSEQVRTSAWESFRLVVAPFLEEMDFSRLAQLYADMNRIPGFLEPHISLAGLSREGASHLERWIAAARESARVLRRIEASNPLLLALKLLRSRRVASEEDPRGAERSKRTTN